MHVPELTVWKFPLSLDDQVQIQVRGARLVRWLDVQLAADRLADPGHPSVFPEFEAWAIVEPDPAREETHILEMRGTGHELGAVGRHIATVRDGIFVWHVFAASGVGE